MLFWLLSLLFLSQLSLNFSSYDPLVIHTTSNQTELPINLKFEAINGYEMATVQGGEVIDLTYIKSLVTPDEAKRLVNICDDRGGWVISPQKGNNNDHDGFEENNARSSSSCPLIWPMLYLARYDDLKAAGKLTKQIENELNLSWSLTQRFSELFDIPVSRFEPFQLIRYEMGQRYKQHHDHGEYYGLSDAPRSTTLLIFLSDVKSAGGETNFPALKLKVEPRQGSGIIWNNVRDIDEVEVVQHADGSTKSRYGRIIQEAIHEGLPPMRSDSATHNDVMVKYAMNVWIREEEIDNLDKEAYKTKG